jgi:GNAT superfamily N-acetyltransferase
MTNYTWRGEFTNNEINALHAQAFGTRIFTDDEWDWKALVASHSLGWIVARDDDVLVGFVNVVWDGFLHAWLQDTMVSQTAGRRGIGTQLVAAARECGPQRRVRIPACRLRAAPDIVFTSMLAGSPPPPQGSCTSRRLLNNCVAPGPVRRGLGEWVDAG